MTDYIQPGVPISQQRTQEPKVARSPFEPSEMELDMMSGRFDRNAYNLAKQQMEQMQNGQYQQKEAAPPQQNDNTQIELDPAFLTSIEQRLASYRQAAEQQQYQTAPAPQVSQPAVYTQPQQTPVAPPVQPTNDTAKTEQQANEQWLQELLGGTNKQPEANTQQPEQAQPIQNQDSFNMRKEEAEKLTRYLEENQKYYNAVELEARRRGVDPLIVAEALSKKPIHEVVDFALGVYKQPVYNPPPQQPIVQQQQGPIVQDPVDMGRQHNNQLPPEEPQVYGGDKNWQF